jgi:hypothetical protein
VGVAFSFSNPSVEWKNALQVLHFHAAERKRESENREGDEGDTKVVLREGESSLMAARRHAVGEPRSGNGDGGMPENGGRLRSCRVKTPDPFRRSLLTAR